MNVKPEVFRFYPGLKMWKMKVKREDFRFFADVKKCGE